MERGIDRPFWQRSTDQPNTVTVRVSNSVNGAFSWDEPAKGLGFVLSDDMDENERNLQHLMNSVRDAIGHYKAGKNG